MYFAKTHNCEKELIKCKSLSVTLLIIAQIAKIQAFLCKINKKVQRGNLMSETNEYQLLYGNRRFGMFIHWGVYSLTGWHEQYLMRQKADRKDYEQLMHRFNPVNYDPEQWARTAKENGMDYICITAKHHDGFCMWNTAQTDYNIMNTPYGRDILKELSDACRKYDVGLSIYYSNPDWHQKNAYNSLSTHQIPPRESDEPDIELYKAFVKAQIRELLTNYGTIQGFFWDIPPKHYDPSINELVRSLQPGIRINDRGYDEGDFSTPERTVPEGFFTRLTEACESIGRKSWGYREHEDYYSSRVLCCNIDTILTSGGNYLLNVGPMPDGRFPDQAMKIFEKTGKWFHSVRESYTDTSPCPELNTADFRTTVRENVLYVHFTKGLDCSGFVLPRINELPVSAEILGFDVSPICTRELVPGVTDENENLIPCIHIYNLPAEESAGYPVVVKLTFDRDVQSMI